MPAFILLFSGLRWTNPWLRGFVLSGLIVLCLGPNSAVAAPSGTSKLRIELTAPDTLGPVPPGTRLTLSIRVFPAGGMKADKLVAVVSGPALATRLFSLDYDEATKDLRADLEIDTPDAVALSTSKRLLPLTVVVAHRTGARLLPLAERLIYFTLGTSPPLRSPDNPASASPPAVPTVVEAPVAERVGDSDSPPLAPALPPEAIREEPLMPTPGWNRTPAYWQAVKGRIAQTVREHLPPMVKKPGEQSPTVHFRLYANGTAQSIHVDPGSGEPSIDEALLRAVFDAQPFAPFPADVTEPHLDIHIAVPLQHTRPHGTITRP